jgi:tRNA isopentenyl-2-thiomethyl-A-37 hydroxylase MiaE
VEASDAQLYDELIPAVQAHSAGKLIYAAPDCPEVYFLSGIKSPSRHYFDYAEESAGYTERILDTIDTLDINVVAINLSPRFSDSMKEELKTALDQRFPHSTEIGHFEVRWKQ